MNLYARAKRKGSATNAQTEKKQKAVWGTKANQQTKKGANCLQSVSN